MREGATSISDAERREVARWAAASAERVVGVFETLVPGDRRPHEAIAIARAFADGGGRSRELTRLAMAAHRAGREAGAPAALAAARAASLAAASANIHGERTIGTLGHILGPAAYATLARELASGGDTAAGDDEARWAIERASPAIRELVRRIPAGTSHRHRLDQIERRLEAALRG